MADDKKAGKKGEAPKEAGKPKGSLMGTLIMYVVIVLVAAGAAVAVYMFVLKPKLSPAAAENAKAGEAVGKDGKVEPVVPVDFDQGVATVLMADPNVPASLLMYQVSMECANAETAEIVKAHKASFAAMLSDLHSFRRREELNDRKTKESIEKVALQKANEILQRYLPKPDPKYKVVEIYHQNWVIEDK